MKKSALSFTAKRRNIFLLDSLGALITTILLFFLLKSFNEFFGLSKTTLEHLSIIAFAFFLYSICCYFLVQQNWKPFLKIICTANILYCILTFGVLLYNYESVSIYGIIYFLGEIVIISGLVFLEIKTIKRIKHP